MVKWSWRMKLWNTFVVKLKPRYTRCHSLMAGYRLLIRSLGIVYQRSLNRATEGSDGCAHIA